MIHDVPKCLTHYLAKGPPADLCGLGSHSVVGERESLSGMIQVLSLPAHQSL